MLEDGEGGEIGVKGVSVQLKLGGGRESMVPAFSAELELMLASFGRESSMMMRTSDRGDLLGDRLPNLAWTQ